MAQITEMTDQTMTVAELRAAWNRANDAALGFPVGEDGDSPADAAIREGYGILAEEGGFVLATDRIGRRVIIADANGPWAVDLADA